MKKKRSKTEDKDIQTVSVEYAFSNFEEENITCIRCS